jgi:hypothetical protein
LIWKQKFLPASSKSGHAFSIRLRANVSEQAIRCQGIQTDETFTDALWGYVAFRNRRVAIGAAAIWNAQWRILRGITIGIHGGPRV